MILHDSVGAGREGCAFNHSTRRPAVIHALFWSNARDISSKEECGVVREVPSVVEGSSECRDGGSGTASGSLRDQAFDAIDKISASTSPSQVATALGRAVGDYGFTALGINGLPPPGEGADLVILAEKVPAGFREYYTADRLYSVDHIGARARTTYEAFRFCDARYDEKDAAAHKRFLHALDTFGIGKGLVVPIGRPDNIPACLWLAGSNPDLRDEAKRAIQLVALFAATKAYALARPPPVGPPSSALTARERDVLRWISAGKTSWEIGSISGLSERAVNKIIADAMAKLDAVTRTQAVVIAIRNGEVEL